MTFRHHLPSQLPRHLPSRREALIGAGSLFAWSQMPRLARAEGRDPRMLVIVLRGALDGLGAVAPVGDPDWIGLRGDRALVLDGKTPSPPARGEGTGVAFFAPSLLTGEGWGEGTRFTSSPLDLERAQRVNHHALDGCTP